MLYYTLIDENVYSERNKIHAAEHSAAIRLLEYAVKKEYGLYSLPEISVGEKGKPYFKETGICFNLSHARGIAVCGISDKNIGVDCEADGRCSMSAAKKIFSAEENAALSKLPENEKPRLFTEIWTAKEAYGKAVGKGLSSALNGICFIGAERAGNFHMRTFTIRSGEKTFIVTAAAEKLSDILYEPLKIIFEKN